MLVHNQKGFCYSGIEGGNSVLLGFYTVWYLYLDDLLILVFHSILRSGETKLWNSPFLLYPASTCEHSLKPNYRAAWTKFFWVNRKNTFSFEVLQRSPKQRTLHEILRNRVGGSSSVHWVWDRFIAKLCQYVW